MRRATHLLVLAAVLVVGFQTAPASGGSVRESSYIVVFDNSVTHPSARAQAQAASTGATVTTVYRQALRGYAAIMTEEGATAVSRLRGVAWVQPDRAMQLDAQVLPTGVDRVDADRSKTARINGRDDRRIDVDIAILDTGLDATHPDLRSVGWHSCVRGADPRTDVHGHGTFVAGNAAAIDNGQYVVGVAPGARVWGVQIFDNRGLGHTSTAICGVEWVTASRTDADPANDIDVANISGGYNQARADDGNCGLTRPDAFHAAICASVRSGVTYTVSAGNEAIDAATKVPAAYDEVITVSAIEDLDGKPGGTGAMFPECAAYLGSDATQVRDDTLAFFSNYGSDIDVTAPGQCVVSTVSLAHNPAGMRIASGTSFSAPYTAGAAALYIANNPAATPAQVRSALIARGSFNWDSSDDPDGVQEPLVNVAAL